MSFEGTRQALHSPKFGENIYIHNKIVKFYFCFVASFFILVIPKKSYTKDVQFLTNSLMSCLK